MRARYDTRNTILKSTNITFTNKIIAKEYVLVSIVSIMIQSFSVIYRYMEWQQNMVKLTIANMSSYLHIFWYFIIETQFYKGYILAHNYSYLVRTILPEVGMFNNKMKQGECLIGERIQPAKSRWIMFR